MAYPVSLKRCPTPEGEVKPGDTVGFKSDIEQYGTITHIRRGPSGYILTLVNSKGFEGHYLQGETKTTVNAQDVWLD